MERVDVAPRVFVIHDDGAKNLLPAMAFGALHTILGKTHHRVYAAQPLVDEIKQAMKTFTQHDYLLLIGDPVAIAVACAWAVQKTGKPVNVLKWDRQERVYYALTFDVVGSPYLADDA